MVALIFTMMESVQKQLVLDHVLNRNRRIEDEPVPRAKTSTSKASAKSKLRRSIGRQLARSTASKNWSSDPSTCVHDADQLRQRGTKDFFWWTCLACGSRWERLEWSGDAVNPSENASSSSVIVSSRAKTAYPSVLPPPKGRKDLRQLTLDETLELAKEREETSLSPSARMTKYLTAQKDKKLVSRAAQPKKAPPSTNPKAESVEPEPPLPEFLTPRTLQMPMTPPEALHVWTGPPMTPASRRSRSMSSGVRPMRERSRPRTPQFEKNVEAFEIHSSDDESRSKIPASPGSEFTVLSPSSQA